MRQGYSYYLKFFIRTKKKTGQKENNKKNKNVDYLSFTTENKIRLTFDQEQDAR